MRLKVALFLLLCFPSAVFAEGEQNAVIRIPSHGASATVIDTHPGFTWILGCAHAYEGKDRNKRMVLDIPAKEQRPPKQVTPELVDVNYQLDLSLVLLRDGPLDFVCPIAPQDWQPSHNVLSIGFDEMKIPPHMDKATVLGEEDIRFVTRERPWHGRSGGGLIDMDAHRLIGVVQGYETTGQRRGLYISIHTIWKFLTPRFNRTQPQRQQFLQPLQPVPCPGGT